MIAVLAAAAIAAAGASMALLRVALDGPEMVVAVRDDADEKRVLTIDCVAGCPRAVHFVEAYDDVPLGLVQPFDREPIVVAVGAGGSAYRVRAYRVTAAGVTRVLDASTLAAPTIGVSADGMIEVRTTERRDDRATKAEARVVTWTWRRGRFDRRRAPARAAEFAAG